jgi:hypothetical protein
MPAARTVFRRCIRDLNRHGRDRRVSGKVEGVDRMGRFFRDRSAVLLELV